MSPNPDQRPEGTVPYLLGQMDSRLDSIDKGLARLNHRLEQAETASGSRHKALDERVAELEEDRTVRKTWIAAVSAGVSLVVGLAVWLAGHLWK